MGKLFGSVARGRARMLVIGGVAALLLGGVGPVPGLLRAQAPTAPVDPNSLQNQVAQSLVRLIVDRPTALALMTQSVATESAIIAQEITARLAVGEGPNSGPPPGGMDVEVAQWAAIAADCARRAQQNLQWTGQDIEVLKGVLGGQLDPAEEPGPEQSLAIMHWVTGLADRQRERNESIDTCLLESMNGLGRLRAYRSLYPG